jgi:alkylation response protein AidB-like acyl-CoA dehydrogenase
VSSDFGFGGMFDPEELQKAMSQFAEQAQRGQQVAFADNAIALAVQMTVAAVARVDPSGTTEEQSRQLRDAITVIYPECVALVREARQGLT